MSSSIVDSMPTPLARRVISRIRSLTMSGSVSATAGTLRAGAVPSVRRMPRKVALTASVLVGDSWPASQPRPRRLGLRRRSAHWLAATRCRDCGTSAGRRRSRFCRPRASPGPCRSWRSFGRARGRQPAARAGRGRTREGREMGGVHVRTRLTEFGLWERSADAQGSPTPSLRAHLCVGSSAVSSRMLLSALAIMLGNA